MKKTLLALGILIIALISLPSVYRSLTLNIHQNMSWNSKNHISKAVKKAQNQLRKEFDLQSKFDAYFIVGFGEEELRKLLEERFSPNAIKTEFDNVIKASCNEKSWGGFSKADVAVLCLPEKYRYRFRKLSIPKRLQAELDTVIAHEYFHVFQYHLVKSNSDSGVTEEWGPEWLVEGTAHYYSAASVLNQRDFTSFINRTKNALGKPTELRTLESYGSFLEDGETLYSNGLIAAHILNTKFSKKSIKEYFIEVSQNDWRQAFLIAFGLSLDEFYGIYDTEFK